MAVDALLAAKGRGRDMPVPVLVGSTKTLSGLTGYLSTDAERLIEAFWPGALTVVVTEAASLAWDLGDAGGTVAVRMPLHPVAIELLRIVGPDGRRARRTVRGCRPRPPLTRRSSSWATPSRCSSTVDPAARPCRPPSST